MTETSASFVPVLILQVSAVLLVMALCVFWPGPWDISHWISLLVAVPAGVLLLVARAQLGKSFSATPQARELVTHGLYSRIRNPMYVFSGSLVFAFLLRLHRPILFVLLLALVAVQIIRARQEAHVLEAKFGEAYRHYRERTWF